MATKSVCEACGMSLDGEASFCPTCGSRMKKVESEPQTAAENIADAFAQNNNIADMKIAPNQQGKYVNDSTIAAAAGNPTVSENPALDAAMNNNSAPVPPVNNGFGNVPPVPPVNNGFGNVPPVPPVNNGFGNIPPVPPMNNGMGGYTIPQPQPQKSGKDVMALIGMILGIVSVVCMCLNLLNLPIAIAGLVLSILGIKSLRRKGMAIAGLICSVVGLIASILIFIWGLAIANESDTYSEIYDSIYEDIYDDFNDYDDYDDYEYNYYYDWD